MFQRNENARKNGHVDLKVQGPVTIGHLPNLAKESLSFDEVSNLVKFINSHIEIYNKLVIALDAARRTIEREDRRIGNAFKLVHDFVTKYEPMIKAYRAEVEKLAIALNDMNNSNAEKLADVNMEIILKTSHQLENSLLSFASGVRGLIKLDNQRREAHSTALYQAAWKAVDGHKVSKNWFFHSFGRMIDPHYWLKKAGQLVDEAGEFFAKITGASAIADYKKFENIVIISPPQRMAHIQNQVVHVANQMGAVFGQLKNKMKGFFVQDEKTHMTMNEAIDQAQAPSTQEDDEDYEMIHPVIEGEAAQNHDNNDNNRVVGFFKQVGNGVVGAATNVVKNAVKPDVAVASSASSSAAPVLNAFNSAAQAERERKEREEREAHKAKHKALQAQREQEKQKRTAFKAVCEQVNLEIAKNSAEHLAQAPKQELLADIKKVMAEYGQAVAKLDINEFAANWNPAETEVRAAHGKLKSELARIGAEAKAEHKNFFVVGDTKKTLSAIIAFADNLQAALKDLPEGTAEAKAEVKPAQ